MIPGQPGGLARESRSAAGCLGREVRNVRANVPHLRYLVPLMRYLPRGDLGQDRDFSDLATPGRAENAVVRLPAGRSQGMDAGRPVSLGCQV